MKILIVRQIHRLNMSWIYPHPSMLPPTDELVLAVRQMDLVFRIPVACLSHEAA